MKMIVAIVRPEKANDVKEALKELGQIGLTLTDVRGHGEQSGIRLSTRVGTVTVDELEKIKFEIVVNDDMEQKCVDAIISMANTGHIGDGRIFIMPVEKSIRIRQD